MSEKGILFSSEMVLAILEGRKTQTRRFIKQKTQKRISHKPSYRIGDLLYVRETWVQKNGEYHYFADSTPDEKLQTKWRPSLHMPKNAARIWLKVKRVSVENLQDISEEDAKAEGVFAAGLYPVAIEFGNDIYRHAFSLLWKSCYGPRAWSENPLVMVIEFKRIEVARGENMNQT